MTATDCYCRGAGVCDRNHHICEGCTCNHDGAPQDILPSETFPKPSGERS